MLVYRLFVSQLTNKVMVNKYLRTYTSKLEKNKIIPIQSLSQLIKQKQKMQIPNLQKQNFQPSQLFLAVLRAIKRNYHHIPQSEVKLFNCLNKYKDDPKYINYFVCLILPIDQHFQKFSSFYKEIALKYLQNQQQFHLQELYIILENLNRIINQQKSLWDDQNWIVRDYTQQQRIIQLFVQRVLTSKNQYEDSFFMKLITICNMLQVKNAQLAMIMLMKINQASFRGKMKQIIQILKYLAKLDSFPYEYFYENKSKWIEAIQSYNKYSRKKSLQIIKMLQIIIMINPMNCQLMIKRIQDVILQAVPSLDNQELANLWYLSTRAKFGIYTHLNKQMLQKMMTYVPNMMNKELCLLVKGFARFNHFSQYKQMCVYTLQKIKEKLSAERPYEHQIIQYLLKSSRIENNIYLK